MEDLLLERFLYDGLERLNISSGHLRVGVGEEDLIVGTISCLGERLVLVDGVRNLAGEARAHYSETDEALIVGKIDRLDDFKLNIREVAKQLLLFRYGVARVQRGCGCIEELQVPRIGIWQLFGKRDMMKMLISTCTC